VNERQLRRAAQLRGRGWGLAEIAKEVGVSTRTLDRWSKRPEFRQEQKRSHAEATAEKPLTLRQTLEAMLLATKLSGAPDWQARAHAARTLATLPPEDAGEREPQVFAVRFNRDGSRDVTFGTPPPGFEPATITLTFEDPHVQP
jgi:hypothetical protein